MLQKYIISKNNKGYTLVELMTALAIVGIFTMVILASAVQSIRVQRFSGNISEIAEVMQQSEVASYSQETGFSAESEDETRYWRGTVLEYTANDDEYGRYLLLGDDMSSLAHNTDQRLGLTDKIERPGTLTSRYSITDRGADLLAIGLECDEISNIDASNIGTVDSACDETVSELSVAFLGSDGRAFVANEIFDNPELTGDEAHFQGEQSFTLVFSDHTTQLTGLVQFDPVGANVNTRVQ